MAFYRCGGGTDTSEVTATAEDVLSPKVIVNADGEPVTGTMTNQGAKTATLNAGGSYTIPKGYHNGSGKVTANSLASQTSATATAEQILYNQTAYVNGSKVTGTMTNQSGYGVSGVTAGESVPIPEGYHNGSGRVITASLSSQTSATATADKITKGYTAWVNGSKITGTKASVTVDGSEVSENCNFVSFTRNRIRLLDLPRSFTGGSAIVNSNTIFILGGKSYSTSNYRSTGESWTADSIPLPYGFYYGSAVEYKTVIHILGGQGDKTKHYKCSLDGNWSSASTLPYSFRNGSAVVYDNEIHILGGMSGKVNHYKWNGSSWRRVSTLPYDFYNGSAVVYNNEIHILGGANDNKTNHYKWNGGSWSSVSTLPYTFSIGSAVVYDNEIHILGGGFGYGHNHYKWNGSSWRSESTLPYDFSDGSAVVYNNEIHILGSSISNCDKNHYILASEAYRKVV